ncbi:MAG: ABC transporter permease [Thermoanaerobaculia bacterium]|nr:ABC transporter permease [Thermoanaerobaculia bacterium]
MIDGLLLDLRQALRLMINRPGFSLVAVVSLALGIAATTLVFGLVSSLLLQTLPAGDPDRLVAVFTSEADGEPYGSSSYPDYLDLRQAKAATADVIAYSVSAFAMSVEGENEVILGERVSDNYFQVLAVDLELGRPFSAADASTRSAEPVAVISHRVWQRRFGGDPGVLGETIILNRQALTVIGVAPEGFHDTLVGLPVSVWVPIELTPLLQSGNRELEERGTRGLYVLGRLAPGDELEVFQAHLDLVAGALAQAHPDTNRDRKLLALPVAEAGFHPELRKVALALGFFVLLVVGIVLLIACLNTANLLLVRAAERQREVSVRIAMGAARGRVLRQLLTESLVLSLVAGGLGLILALWATALLRHYQLPLPVPIPIEINLDGRSFAFALLVATATGVFFGLTPALQTLKVNLVSALKNEPLAIGRGYRKFGLRNLLIVAQVAVSSFLLIGAALFLRSLSHAEGIDPGFATKGSLIAAFDLETQGYDDAEGSLFYARMLEQVRSTPGVRTAAIAKSVPLTFETSRIEITPPAGERAADEEAPEINFNTVSGGYLGLMSIPILRGRDFDDGDVAGTEPVVIVNETMAKRYWPDRDAVGERLTIGNKDHRVIGVARDAKYETLGESPKPFLYLPYTQSYEARMVLHVKTDGEPLALAEPLRNAVRAVDPYLPVQKVGTLEEQVSIALLPARIGGVAFAFFGFLTLVLAAIGNYGVVAHSVARRTREVGIRMALGARQADVLGLVVKEAMTLISIGVVIGVVASLVSMPLMLNLLYGVSGTDPLSYLAIVVVIAAVGLAASFIPARRASRLAPMLALRDE